MNLRGLRKIIKFINSNTSWTWISIKTKKPTTHVLSICAQGASHDLVSSSGLFQETPWLLSGENLVKKWMRDQGTPEKDSAGNEKPI